MVSYGHPAFQLADSVTVINSGAEKENRAHMETRIIVLFRPHFYCPWNSELALMGH